MRERWRRFVEWWFAFCDVVIGGENLASLRGKAQERDYYRHLANDWKQTAEYERRRADGEHRSRVALQREVERLRVENDRLIRGKNFSERRANNLRGKLNILRQRINELERQQGERL